MYTIIIIIDYAIDHALWVSAGYYPHIDSILYNSPKKIPYNSNPAGHPQSNNITALIYLTLHVLYSMSTAGVVAVTDLNYEESSLTLICTSTGGPATTVTWTKDGASLAAADTYQQSQTITDMLTATYENRLSIITRSDSVSGDYACTVQNSNSIASSPQSISVTGKEV